MTYRNIRKAATDIRLDRDTWAKNSVVIMAYDTSGVGTFETEVIDFGLVFEDTPFFAYGAELQPGQTLIDGDFPIINCGVGEWATTKPEDDPGAKPFYIGASLWIVVNATTPYNLRFRLSFEGIAMSNVEYFRT
jgi:hypothetical protein